MSTFLQGFRQSGNQTSGLLSCIDQLERWTLPEASLDIMRKTKALISLCGCAVWSAPLFFACSEIRFSRHEVWTTFQPCLLTGTNSWFSYPLHLKWTNVFAARRDIFRTENSLYIMTLWYFMGTDARIRSQSLWYKSGPTFSFLPSWTLQNAPLIHDPQFSTMCVA